MHQKSKPIRTEMIPKFLRQEEVDQRLGEWAEIIYESICQLEKDPAMAPDEISSNTKRRENHAA